MGETTAYMGIFTRLKLQLHCGSEILELIWNLQLNGILHALPVKLLFLKDLALLEHHFCEGEVNVQSLDFNS
jgi:hypothetical protein